MISKIYLFSKSMINQGILRSVAALMACALLTQCASVFPQKGRAGKLKSIGYTPLKLQKIPGDERYSGTFDVNGAPMRFLIDSGANSTDLTERYATEARLKRDPSVSVISRGALGREVKSGLGRGSLRIGPVVAENFAFTIGPDTGKRTATSRYAGQIGLDAMSAAGSLIDIQRGALWVPEKVKLAAFHGRPVSLGIQRGLGLKALKLYPAGRFPHLILEGRVDGDQVTWVVDTGAEVSVMAEESFLKFNLPSEVTNSSMIDAAGDKIPVRAAVLYNVEFPGVNIGQFSLIVAPLADVRRVFKDSNGRPVDGILGMDFLTQSQALLDPGSKVLYVGAP